ncbi:MAG: hypothetical protein K9J30_13760 [Bacteroidales bacterium]|nr:hypothetical protein [Bacteroidales bacterium]
MNRNFYARGKLLLTSEFMILHGAKALAVPLKKGQSLVLTDKRAPGVLHWQARYNNDTWFSAEIDINEMKVENTSSSGKSEYLLFILKKIIEIKPEFVEQIREHDVVTNLEFDPGFGFGSSSTLTALLAQWAEIDAMQLHFHISRGSGYDVACATAGSAILYQVVNDMPVVESVDFEPAFADHMFLAYLGQKQDSGKSVAAFLENYTADQQDVGRFTALTCEFVKSASLQEMGQVIREHERALSEILKMPALKESRFSDLEGDVKSLGAWGGDFALVVTPWKKEEFSIYLEKKGTDLWFAYDTLVL